MKNQIVGKIFDLSNMHLHGSAFYEFLTLRKRFFVDTLAWDIPHNDEVEMDQYDNPTAAYSVVIMNGRLVAGARVMRFSDKWGTHGCMLQDAAEGRIDGIPADLLPNPQSFAKASECTRLVLSDQIASPEDRQECLALVVQGLVELAIRQGSDDLVTLTVPGFRRSLRKLGYEVEQVGEKYRNKHDGRSYAILAMPAIHATSAGAQDATVQMRRQANV
ncbi:acyl-homoserine-lactone synthase [Oceaniovalibus sp. ACAM 378]|jgi:acyl homoserine lactone synthase|uniref:acyl-homoserine-lactone synthase n=1 Tax=Oceaniovalibus sp. ACAM 378 TaxID=2599923 RepID=UPI0011D7C163|nr:acyl-homoserine-lactone synthase [Oceaniovalibus sp. ACAM 378]TYB90676.1 autoinducer synthase [Oceaniovalibus sp. ACAM 378]